MNKPTKASLQKLKNTLQSHFNSLTALLILIYLCLLTININAINLFIADEKEYSSTVELLFKGIVGVNNHPLLAKTIWYYFVYLFSGITGIYSPFIWRSGTIFLSMGCLIVFYKIARFFFNKTISLYCVVILAVDPMFFSFSRLVQLEIPLLFFLLCSIYYFFQFLETKNKKSFYICGFLLGLSLACKASSSLLIPLLPLIAISLKKNEKWLKTFIVWLKYQISFLLVTLTAFIIGNSIFLIKAKYPSHFYRFFEYLINSQLGLNAGKETFLYSPAWSWFTIPQILTLFRMIKKDMVIAIYSFMNPILNISFWIVILFIINIITKKRTKNRLFIFTILSIIFCLYLPWFFNIHITFYYYVTPMIPFIILLFIKAVSYIPYKNTVYIFFLIYSLIQFIVFYPMLVGLPVPKKYDDFLFSYSRYNYPKVNKYFCQLCSPHDPAPVKFKRSKNK